MTGTHIAVVLAPVRSRGDPHHCLRQASHYGLVTWPGARLMVPEEERGSFVEEHETSDDAELVLYGVVGLQRGQGGAQGGTLALVRDGRRTRAVRTSEGLSFAGPEGGSITVTSHRRGDGDQFQHIREGAAIGPFLASPHGRAAWAAGDMAGRRPRPVEVEWAPVTILVDGQGTPFEVCDLGDGYWAAAGRVPAAATITIDSRQVPISAVSLERLASREPPPPPVPYLGDRTETVVQSLDDRFAQVPFSRVHGLADYWALRAVEVDHVSRRTVDEGLSDQQLEALKAYWLRRIEDRLREPMDRVRLHTSKQCTVLGSPDASGTGGSFSNCGSTRSGRGPRPGSAIATSASATTPSVSAGDHNGSRPHQGRRHACSACNAVGPGNRDSRRYAFHRWVAGTPRVSPEGTLWGSHGRGTETSAEEVRCLDQIVGNAVNSRSVDR